MSIIDIINSCIEKGYNPRIFNYSDLLFDSESGYYFKLLMTAQEAVSEDIFVHAIDAGLYVNGLFNIGITLPDYNNVKVSLFRLSRSIPDRLQIANYSGPYSLLNSLSEEVSQHLNQIDEWFDGHTPNNNSVSEFLDIPSPYGECIPVDGFELADQFNYTDDELCSVTDQAYATSKFKFNKKNNFNKPIQKPQPKPTVNTTPLKRKGGVRQGEVWWVSNLECSKEQKTSPYFKNRPVIIIQVVRGIVTYYRCTTNNIMYYYRKIRLKEPFEDGLNRDPVFVELEEMEMPESRLRDYKGYLTDIDQNEVFHPEDIPYWKNQFKPVD